MQSGKRILAGILAAVMVLSSVQFPASTVRAEEMPSAQAGLPDEGTVTPENASQQEQGQDDGESQQESGIAASEEEETQQPEAGAAEEASVENGALGEDVEKPKDEAEGEDDETDDEADDVLPSYSGQVSGNDLQVSGNHLQVSGNDLQSVEEQEIRVEDELEGVYQFGGAPSEKESASPYTLSSYSQTAVEEYLYEQMKARRTQINTVEFNIPLSEMQKIVSGVLNENPDLYFVDKNINFRFMSSTTWVTIIEVTYAEGLDDAKWQSGVNAALASVSSDMSDLQKAIALHDYLTVNCEYDQENLKNGSVPETSHSTYGVFADRIAVCDGYALSYKYLLSRVGIDCYMVTSDEINHAWNLIKLDGQYYQVDVTWDDPVWDLVGRSGHTYMLRSDANFDPADAQQKHSGGRVTYGSQTVDYQAVDTRYDNAFWTDVKSPLVFSGNDCYYISFDESVAQASLRKGSLTNITGSGAAVQNIGRWTGWGNSSSYYRSAYSGLFRLGGRLYYNDTASIYSIAMDGTDRKTEFTADTANGYIYGSAFCQGKVLYSLHQSPNLTAREEVLEADIQVDDKDPAPVPPGEDPAPTPPAEEEKGLDLDNPSLQFTALDGTTIRSDAEGRPKLLIFYSNTCGNCRGTISGISGKINSFAGVDIYALEVTKQSKEDVTSFREKYGCEEIVFSHDTGNTNANGMWKYAWAVEVNNISWPVICYIDANNRLQYVTFSLIAADDVLSNLKKYCMVSEGETFSVQRPDKTTYKVGEKPDVTGGKLTYPDNGTAKTVDMTADMLSGFDSTKPGICTVTVTYGNYRASFDTLIVEEPKLAGVYGQRLSDVLLPENDYGTYSWQDSTQVLDQEGEHAFGAVFTPRDTDKFQILTDLQVVVNVRNTPVNGFNVTFDVQGHGTAPAAYVDVKAGSTIRKPKDPVAVGYRFGGWYRDAACKKAWNFDTDAVQEDMTLYAKWTENDKKPDGFALEEIADIYYTGKPCKPVVTVYDGESLLKAGRDYQVRYYNNMNANADGKLKKGNGTGADFQQQLPYVEIIGRGNYTDRIKNGAADTVKVNFNILRAPIGDGTEQQAVGVTLKMSEQLVKAEKVQKPFASIKYVKSMKQDADFRLHLTAVNATDSSGNILKKNLELPKAEIPAGYEGEFLLTVEGTGNYEGSVCRTVWVADQAHLMKNASITLGKNLKNVEFTGKAIELTPSEEASPDTFTVKCGNTFLKPGRDYTVSYRNHDKVGKAELVITGNGEYVGKKTAAFRIKGKAFSAKTVQVNGVTDQVYTGRALTQNGVRLTYGTAGETEKSLRYGTDYTITYARNTDKGTATMTFTGKETAGYSGSFKKTFRITPADIADQKQVIRADTMNSMVFSYCKAGVKPVEEIRLTNREGLVLRNGKDYTLKYRNNKAVALASAAEPPTVTVQGKGNYTGTFDVCFRITKRDLRATGAGAVQARLTAAAYRPGKAQDYAYQPAVKLMDGKSALRAGTDYEVQYMSNTQADFEMYLRAYEQAVKSGRENPNEGLQALRPRAVITAKPESNYTVAGERVIWLPIYRTKLIRSKLQIDVQEAVYTGRQVMPAVTVRDTVSGRILEEDRDYTVSYGANNTSGKNKGSVTITGTAPEYGGSVTVKFDIARKPVDY